MGSDGDAVGAAPASLAARLHPAMASASSTATARATSTVALFAPPSALPRYRMRAHRQRARAREIAVMSRNADILLLTYSMILVGLTTGLQMLFYGIVLRRSMNFGAEPVTPERLRQGGVVFTVAGCLAFAVMAVEILSGAAGTFVLPFAIATIAVPIIGGAYNAWRSGPR
jgi:hypothetical protein